MRTFERDIAAICVFLPFVLSIAACIIFYVDAATRNRGSEPEIRYVEVEVPVEKKPVDTLAKRIGSNPPAEFQVYKVTIQVTLNAPKDRKEFMERVEQLRTLVKEDENIRSVECSKLRGIYLGKAGKVMYADLPCE